jgi:hypothetical protein
MNKGKEGSAKAQTERLEDIHNWRAEGLINTNTRGARQLESRLDLHARGTKGGGIGGHTAAFGCGDYPPVGKVLTGCPACGFAARSSLRSRRPASGPRPPI